jgi:hypothetical protein
VDHVVHSGVSGARNVNRLVVILRWDWFGLQKKRAETC